MGFSDAIRSGFKNYITISGRAARSEFWFWQLFTIIVSFATGLIDGSLFNDDVGTISSLASLAMFLPTLMVSIRRLHDRDQSGWWLLLMLIPLVGWLVLLYFYVTPGTDGPNRFGDDPLGGVGPDDWDANMPSQGFHRSSIPRVDRKD